MAYPEKKLIFKMGMKVRLLGILFFIVSSAVYAQVSNSGQKQEVECTEYAKSSDVKIILSFLKKENIQAFLWPSYHLALHDLILTNITDAPKCAVFVKDAQVEKVATLGEPIHISNGAFDFYMEGQPTPLGELAQIFKSEGTKFALVWSLDFYSNPFAKFGIPKELGPSMEFWAMVHEGFHLFVQDSGVFPFPRWPVADGRKSTDKIANNLENSCYAGNQKIRALFDNEYNDLLKALPLAYQGKSDQVMIFIRDFVSKRNLRYAELSSTFIETQTGKKI